jgi:hypothetical protein
MARMLASSELDRGFKLQLERSRDYKIGNNCFSLLNTQH